MHHKKEILVTGGLGFIGSHTVVELMNSGFHPVIVDDLSNSSSSVLDGIEKITGKRPPFYQFNILESEKLFGILQEHHIDAVIHFAAFKAVGESVAEPLKYYQNNVGGLISLLAAMKQFEIKNLVFSSSCTVYGQPAHLPVTEESHVVNAESPYGNTKKIGEEIIADHSKTKAIKAISLRYFNPVGAHPSSEIGELPIGVPNNLVPFITQTAAGWREQLTVFGNDYDTLDGTCVRDYIHVVDLAKAHVVSLKRLQNSEETFEMFNIGTGKGTTVLQVIEAFEKTTNQTLNFKMGPRRAGDVERVWADCAKANAVLQWHAELGIDRMMHDAWEWQKRLKEKG